MKTIKHYQMTKTTKEKITVKRNKLIKCPTGIKGFDEITEGGLPQNGITFVSSNDMRMPGSL